MLLALMQSLGMGGGEGSVVVVVQAGGKPNRPPRRKRRYHDDIWKRDILYATAALQRELTEQQRLRAEEEPAEYESETEEAAEIVADAVEFVGGGLSDLPDPPERVARAIVSILDYQPDYAAILEAIRDARQRAKDADERAQIAAYQERVMVAHRKAVAFAKDEEDTLEMMMESNWL